MKKNLLFAIAMFFAGTGTFAQTYPPSSFSYGSYVTAAHDQLIQKPCFVHATIAGLEATYKLYYNQVLDLSERALFSCCRPNNNFSQSLSEVVNYVHQNGAIFESCKPYPSSLIPCSSSNNMQLWDIIYDTSFDCQQTQKDCGYRFKINTTTVAMTDINTVKKNLLSYGPIIFTNGDHAMLLIGWTSTNQWIVKDSYPCNASAAKSVNFNDPYVNFGVSYIITGVTKEKYNSATNTWSVETPPAKIYQNFGLGFLRIVTKTTPSPLCYNRGIEYELQGLENLTGVVCSGWTYEASSNYNKELTLSVNGNRCTVSGNAAGVTLYALIQRQTGIMEKVALSIGNVGVPAKLNALNGHCSGTNYEITSFMDAAFLSGVSYNFSYNIPASSDGSYYASTSGQYAWWVFRNPNVVRYTATVTASKSGCSSISNTQTAYMYGSYCGYSYSAKSDKDSTSDVLTAKEIENSLVSPNPVRDNLTLTHVGEGTNDIRIYDLIGNLVYSIKIEETMTIDVRMIPRGVYIVKYIVSDGTKVKPVKIVLE